MRNIHVRPYPLTRYHPPDLHAADRRRRERCSIGAAPDRLFDREWRAWCVRVWLYWRMHIADRAAAQDHAGGYTRSSEWPGSRARRRDGYLDGARDRAR